MSNANSGHDFYCRILDILDATGVEFLVGGAFALDFLAGIQRDTKDFDLMLRPRDVERALGACRDGGFYSGYAFSHWIAKVHHGEHFIDLIFRAGNGLCEVDDEWFAAAPRAEVLGRPLLLCPAEEMIWQKAFVMERERFDGADIQHLLHANARTLDWTRLARRFGDDWRVLLSHLILFGYVYPALRDTVPLALLDDYLRRLRAEAESSPAKDKTCAGTLLSRAQYLPDVEQWGYDDARNQARVAMTAQELAAWTNAIDRRQHA
jgi:hypothetical protein